MATDSFPVNHPGGDAFSPLPYPPPDWHYVQGWGNGHAFARKNGLRVLIDCEKKEDGRLWLHVSFSRKDWTPSHADACIVKRDFIGDRYAYAVFPPQDKYVNIHSHCLHLWALAEGESGIALPEFSGTIDGIGRSI